MFCIQCGEKQIDDSAKNCYKCSAPIPSRDAAKNLTSSASQEQKAAPAKNPPSPLLILGSGCLFVVFIMICGFIMLYVCAVKYPNSSSVTLSSPSPTPSSTPKKQQLGEIDRNSKLGKNVFARSIFEVRSRLYCPKTAKFSRRNDRSVIITRFDDDCYKCRGYVDSQNKFGALIRTYFVVSVYFKDEGWFKDYKYLLLDVKTEN